MIVPMLRIEVAVLREAFQPALAFLHQCGVVHIEPLAERPDLPRLALTREDEDARNTLETLIRDISEILDPETPSPTPEQIERLESKPTKALASRFEEISKEFSRPKAELEELREERRVLPHLEGLIGAFLSVEYAFPRRADWAMVGLVLDRTWEKDLRVLRDEIHKVTRGRMELSAAPLDPGRLVAIVFFDEAYEKELERLIWGKGIDHLALPRKYLGRPLEEVLKEIAERSQEIPEEMERAGRALDRARETFALELAAIRKVARARLKELSIRTAFVESRYTIALAGWIPESEAPGLKKSLEERFGNQVFVRVRPPLPEEWAAVPVSLQNPAVARPFEILLLPVAAPRYGALDPTILLGLFFPSFFGLMVGDIGHGFMIVLLALALRRWARRIPKAVPSILLAMGAWSILFGLLFGELFGDLGKPWLAPLLFDRTERMIPFLALALAIGVAHVSFGFVLGIIGALRTGESRRATEKAATLGAILGGLVLLGAAGRALPAGWMTPGLVLMLAMIPVLLYAGGIIALLELFSAAGHILSYARLMALGLASAMLAHVANRLGTAAGNIVLGVSVALLLHLLHLVMSLFSPTVQSLRLQYVEFFSKFYEPGGVAYAPFRK